MDDNNTIMVSRSMITNRTVQVDAELISQMSNIGFSEEHGREALRRCNNVLDEAIMFCVEHGDGMNIFAAEQRALLAAAAKAPVIPHSNSNSTPSNSNSNNANTNNTNNVDDTNSNTQSAQLSRKNSRYMPSFVSSMFGKKKKFFPDTDTDMPTGVGAGGSGESSQQIGNNSTTNSNSQTPTSASEASAPPMSPTAPVVPPSYADLNNKTAPHQSAVRTTTNTTLSPRNLRTPRTPRTQGSISSDAQSDLDGEDELDSVWTITTPNESHSHSQSQLSPALHRTLTESAIRPGPSNSLAAPTGTGTGTGTHALDSYAHTQSPRSSAGVGVGVGTLSSPLSRSATMPMAAINTTINGNNANTNGLFSPSRRVPSVTVPGKVDRVIKPRNKTPIDIPLADAASGCSPNTNKNSEAELLLTLADEMQSNIGDMTDGTEGTDDTGTVNTISLSEPVSIPVSTTGTEAESVATVDVVSRTQNSENTDDCENSENSETNNLTLTLNLSVDAEEADADADADALATTYHRTTEVDSDDSDSDVEANGTTGIGSGIGSGGYKRRGSDVPLHTLEDVDTDTADVGNSGNNARQSESTVGGMDAEQHSEVDAFVPSVAGDVAGTGFDSFVPSVAGTGTGFDDFVPSVAGDVAGTGTGTGFDDFVPSVAGDVAGTGPIFTPSTASSSTSTSAVEQVGPGSTKPRSGSAKRSRKAGPKTKRTETDVTVPVQDSDSMDVVPVSRQESDSKSDGETGGTGTGTGTGGTSKARVTTKKRRPSKESKESDKVSTTSSTTSSSSDTISRPIQPRSRSRGRAATGTATDTNTTSASASAPKTSTKNTPENADSKTTGTGTGTGTRRHQEPEEKPQFEESKPEISSNLPSSSSYGSSTGTGSGTGAVTIPIAPIGIAHSASDRQPQVLLPSVPVPLSLPVDTPGVLAPVTVTPHPHAHAGCRLDLTLYDIPTLESRHIAVSERASVVHINPDVTRLPIARSVFVPKDVIGFLLEGIPMADALIPVRMMNCAAAVTGVYTVSRDGVLYMAVAAPLPPTSADIQEIEADRGGSFTGGLRDTMKAKKGVGAYVIEGDHTAKRGSIDSMTAETPLQRRKFLPYEIFKQTRKIKNGAAEIGYKSVISTKQPNNQTPGGLPVMYAVGVCSTLEDAKRVCLQYSVPRWGGNAANLDPSKKPVKKGDLQACTICHNTFALMYPGHHCRNCGFMVCETCSGKDMITPDQYYYVSA